MDFTVKSLESMTVLLQSDKVEGAFRESLEKEYLKFFDLLSRERELGIKQLDKLSIQASNLTL